MENKSPITVGQEVWFCPSYEGDNSLGCFLVKCKVTQIYILDGNRKHMVGPNRNIPCSTLVNLHTDQDKRPPNCEGCIVFYELDEPIGHDVDRESIFALEEFDEEGIQEWLSDEKADLIARSRFFDYPDLYKWRERKVEFLNKNGCPGLKATDYLPKEKNKDWFSLNA